MAVALVKAYVVQTGWTSQVQNQDTSSHDVTVYAMCVEVPA